VFVIAVGHKCPTQFASSLSSNIPQVKVFVPCGLSVPQNQPQPPQSVNSVRLSRYSYQTFLYSLPTAPCLRVCRLKETLYLLPVNNKTGRSPSAHPILYYRAVPDLQALLILDWQPLATFILPALCFVGLHIRTIPLSQMIREFSWLAPSSLTITFRLHQTTCSGVGFF